MENNILSVFKNKPIEMIFRISSLATAIIIFSHIIKNDNLTLYLVIGVSLILIYTIYVRVKLDYEKVYTKVEIFKFRFSLVNGYLIIKSLYFIIISLIMIWFNSNPFQKEKINNVLIILVALMAICLLMFVKITPTRSTKSSLKK